MESLDDVVLSVHKDVITYTRHFPPVQESLVSFLSIFSFEIDTFIKAKALESCLFPQACAGGNEVPRNEIAGHTEVLISAVIRWIYQSSGVT